MSRIGWAVRSAFGFLLASFFSAIVAVADGLNWFASHKQREREEANARYWAQRRHQALMDRWHEEGRWAGVGLIDQEYRR